MTGAGQGRGCTSFAYETAWYGGGDDIALLRALTPADAGSLPDIAKHIARGAARGAGALTRVKSVARLLGDPGVPKRLAAAHCEQAVRLAARLGAAPQVTEILGQTYERFDGKGGPLGLRGEAVAPLARVMHVAYCAVLHGSFDGPFAALEIVRERSGGELDPAVCDALMKRGRDHLAILGAASVWDEVLIAEPPPRLFVTRDRMQAVAEAFAHFVDLKSPYTIGHSVGVSRLCEAALARGGASEEEREQGRLAGLLHDLGRASVPNGIWDKARRSASSSGDASSSTLTIRSPCSRVPRPSRRWQESSAPTTSLYLAANGRPPRRSRVRQDGRQDPRRRGALRGRERSVGTFRKIGHSTDVRFRASYVRSSEVARRRATKEDVHVRAREHRSCPTDVRRIRRG